jgi:4-carboxymuconolactone decarboxylase
MPPRIVPVPPTGNDAAVQELLDIAESRAGGASNVFRTIAHHPSLLRRYLQFAGKLIEGGSIPPRDREIVILRVAFLLGSEYEWHQHVRMGKSAGLADEEVNGIRSPPLSGGSAAWDSRLIHWVDEFVARSALSDRDWEDLHARYNDAQIVELFLLMGHYVMLADFLAVIGVEVEAD